MYIRVSHEDHSSNNAEHSQMELLTEKQLAKYLAITLSCCRKWRLLNEGPPFLKIGRLVRYQTNDVHEWLSKRRQGNSRLNGESNLRGTN